MKYWKYEGNISGHQDPAPTTQEMSSELREKWIDNRLQDLQTAFNITAKLLNEERWTGDLVLTDACRKYRMEMLDLKQELKQILVQKYEEKK